MKIAIERITPGEDELSPSLWVDLVISDYEPNMCQLDICGSLFSDTNTFLSIGEEITKDRGLVSSNYRALYNCDVEVINRGYRAHSVSTLRFPLDERAFNYVNDLKLRNENMMLF